jgi:hypothetical protein
MKLSNVLAKIGGTEKTAHAAPASAPATGEKSATAQTEERLRAALKEATAPAPAADKTASAAGSPAADVTKLASEVLGAEHAALVKEAEFYGAAVCDGFMARLAQYDGAAQKIAAEQMGSAVATLQPGQPLKLAAADDSFDKFASANPELVKEAAELGFERTMLQMDKLASAAYDRGYNEGVTTIYKVAHQSFTAGYEDTLRLIEAARS